MNFLLEIDINIFMFIALAIFLMIAMMTLDRKDRSLHVYINMTIITMMLLALESIAVLLDAKPGTDIYVWLHVIYVIIFLLAILLSFYWYFMMKKFFKPSNRGFVLIESYIFVVQIINVIVIVASPWSGQIFYIDGNNFYHRGYAFFIQTLAIYYYPLLALFLLVKEKKYIANQDFIILLTSICLPLLIGFLQVLNLGVLSIWPSTALALIVTYVFLRQKMIQYDALTGAWRRGSFFEYVKQREVLKVVKPFGALYFDLNNLKKINDIQGHVMGDEAIISAVKVIKDVVGKSVLARLGGDEFIAILDVDSQTKIDLIMDAVKKSVKRYNEKSKLPFELSISMGGDLFDDRYMDFDAFLEHIDKLMYEDKERYRRQIQK